MKMNVAVLLLTMLSASAGFVLAPMPRGSTRLTAVRMASDSEQTTTAGKKASSALNLTSEEMAERKEKQKLINRFLPLTVVGALAINIVTGGALQKIEIGMPGPGPPGLAEARKLKAEGAERSKAAYSKGIKADETAP